MPTALNHSAQGWTRQRPTLGKTYQKFRNPERVGSIPHVSLIEINFISPQQFPKFVLKRDLAMMIFLPCNITANSLDL